jgi:hypothetical protein
MVLALVYYTQSTKNDPTLNQERPDNQERPHQHLNPSYLSSLILPWAIDNIVSVTFVNKVGITSL